MADNTARERRMQRLKEEQRKELPKTIVKTVGIAVIAVLVVGGIGYAVFNASTSSDDCPGHWHATVGVFIQDESGDPARVPFLQPPYELGGPGSAGRHDMAMHMHGPDQQQLHFEPVGRRDCIGVEETMEELGIDLSANRMVLSGDAHEQTGMAGTYANNDTQEIRYFVHSGGSQTLRLQADDEMREESFASLRDYQLVDGEKLLIAYGDFSDEELEGMMAQIKWPSGAVAAHPGG